MRDENGRFTEGNKGRPKGAVSKKTKAWNTLEDAVVGGLSEQVAKILGQLAKDDPQAFLDTIVKFYPYFKPKKRAIEEFRPHEEKEIKWPSWMIEAGMDDD